MSNNIEKQKLIEPLSNDVIVSTNRAPVATQPLIFQ